MKLMKTSFFYAAILVSAGLFAEDLTVAIGESVTISEETTYDNLVLDGSLSIADGVKLTANTSLVVANGIDGTATLTLGANSTVEASGVKFGVGAGRAEVTLGTGSYFKANGAANVCCGYDTEPSDADAKATEASLVIGEQATFYCGTDLTFGGGTKPENTKATEVKAVIRLNNGATLSVQRITDNITTSERIEFNGGRVE